MGRIDGRAQDNFVIQMGEEESVQYLVFRDRKFIYFDWVPGQTLRTLKLDFICSNRCCE